MKRSELRIGDIVTYRGKAAPIYDLARDVVWFDEGSVSALIKDVSPVPITEEILDNISSEGCTHTMHGVAKVGLLTPSQFSTDSRLIVELEEGKVYVWLGFLDRQADTGYPFLNKQSYLGEYDYLHQLQHLLWALGMDDDLKI